MKKPKTKLSYFTTKANSTIFILIAFVAGLMYGRYLKDWIIPIIAIIVIVIVAFILIWGLRDAYKKGILNDEEIKA